jgi:hypothetical protein
MNEWRKRLLQCFTAGDMEVDTSSLSDSKLQVMAVVLFGVSLLFAAGSRYLNGTVQHLLLLLFGY